MLVLAEGKTERQFVSLVLAPHLRDLQIDVSATVLQTRRRASGPDWQGGYTTFAKTKKQILGLLGDTSADLVTTFLDYYGLPHDCPGIDKCPDGSSQKKVAHVESALKADIDRDRFLPYLSLHEFEALLFACPEKVNNAFPGTDKLAELRRIRTDFKTPEDINDDKDTCPSARLAGLFPGYQKTVEGPTISRDIGLDVLRRECPHFNGWVTHLEQLQEG